MVEDPSPVLRGHQRGTKDLLRAAKLRGLVDVLDSQSLVDIPGHDGLGPSELSARQVQRILLQVLERDFQDGVVVVRYVRGVFTLEQQHLFK